ncbi:MAG: Hpt domain-containing protein [Terricaulis sp.]|nr:Hpt domain-containing protein [Terricaulis sp.]
MDDILRDFIAEANDSIDALDRALVRFEREPEDPDLLSEIFRVMHTIKGTCGFLGLARLAAIAHAGENILGQFRDGALTPQQDSVSAILEAIDLIKALISHLEAHGAEPAGDDGALIGRLNAIASADAPAPAADEPLAARLGGLSTIDCAIELALARAKASPEGVRLHGAQDDALHSALRDAAWGAISGEAGPSLSAALNQLGLGGEAELVLLCKSWKRRWASLALTPKPQPKQSPPAAQSPQRRKLRHRQRPRPPLRPRKPSACTWMR